MGATAVLLNGLFLLSASWRQNEYSSAACVHAPLEKEEKEEK